MAGRVPRWRIPDLYDPNGRPRPDVFAAHLDREGVSRALLFSEYSPRVTGWQVIEDLLPFREYDPERFAIVANVNPHVHHPLAGELRRQLDLGAIALKLHPVHGGFPDGPARALPRVRPVRVAERADLRAREHEQLPRGAEPVREPRPPGGRGPRLPRLHLFLLSHGGRGWSYDTAAMLALTYDNVWIDIAGLPPRRLPDYYARFDLGRLARRFVFGGDWPGLPSISGNIAAIRDDLGLPEETVEAVLYGNAARIFGFEKD